MTAHRRRLLTYDDPLEPAPERTTSQPAREELRALYVRLPIQDFDDLARAAFELQMPKRELVGALIRKYVRPHSQEGLKALRDLLLDEHLQSEPAPLSDGQQAR